MRPVGSDAARGVPTDMELVDALKSVMGCLHAALEAVVQPIGMPPPQAVALRRIEGSLSMKELGQRMRCDASFITAIADSLEERGLVRREIDQQDRRIKNLVLTKKGAQLRDQLEQSLHMVPALQALDADERRTLLGLLRKMNDASSGSCPIASAGSASATPE